MPLRDIRQQRLRIDIPDEVSTCTDQHVIGGARTQAVCQGMYLTYHGWEGMGPQRLAYRWYKEVYSTVRGPTVHIRPITTSGTEEQYNDTVLLIPPNVLASA